MRIHRRSIVQLVVVLLTLCFVSATYAQDAAQVLRMSVGFRTVKNTATMDEATKQQVAELEKKANEANAAQKYGEALKHMTHGLALMRKQPWTPLDAFKAALVVKAERLIFDPGEAVNVKLSQLFTLDEPVAGALTLALTLNRIRDTKTEKIKDLKAPAEVPADFTQTHTLNGLLPANASDGTYQLLATFTFKTGATIENSTTIYIQRDLLAQARLLKARCTEMAKSVDSASLSPFRLLSSRAAYAANLIDLINANQMPLGRYNLSEEIANAHAMLDDLTAGKSPLFNKRGDIHWAYQSVVDNTPQPYRIFVPGKYDAKQKWPLIVALHGMGGNENSFFDSYNKGVIKEEAEKRGYLILCPKGRGPADMYLGNAQKDVIDSLAHVRQLYNIDEDRVYLMGHSMGGYGTWITAVNQPELFAGLAPFSGGGIAPVMMGLKKIAHVPWFVVHGDNDPTVSVEESRKMVKAGEALGIKITYKEVPGGDHSNMVVPAFKDMYDFFDAHKRQLPKPQVKAAGNGQ